MYELDVERLLKEIGKTNAKRVLIQLPDGMKTKAAAFTLQMKLGITGGDGMNIGPMTRAALAGIK